MRKSQEVPLIIRSGVLFKSTMREITYEQKQLLWEAYIDRLGKINLSNMDNIVLDFEDFLRKKKLSYKTTYMVPGEVILEIKVSTPNLIFKNSRMCADNLNQCELGYQLGLLISEFTEEFSKKICRGS